MATEITNKQFERFVKETNYVTVAEKDVDWEQMSKQVPPGTPRPADSLMVAGSLVFKKTTTAVDLSDYFNGGDGRRGQAGVILKVRLLI